MAFSPINIVANAGKEFYGSSMNPIAYTEFGRSAAAACELLERMTRRYMKPEFEIEEIEVKGKKVAVSQKTISRRTFCNLLHFKKDSTVKQPKMLVVAPMSGHFATLLRGTVRDLLPHFDVYITDWLNASDIPVSKGKFDLDDYIDYVSGYIQMLGKEGDLHITAVCQPAVPVLASVSLLSSQHAEDKSVVLPKTMTLIGGPIDTRKSPTEVNKLAETRSIEWFEQNVISAVPFNYPGFMRKVYPGFLQLTGFMTMNLDRHIEAHQGLFNHLVEGDGDSADAHKAFYNEYLSVMDITAEFYLQTIKAVFKEHSLPDGTMISCGRKVIPADIKKTALLCVEGERDDISGRGQTKAAINLCKGLPDSKKHYHLQKNVGHYGAFNGRRFREQIVPVIVDFAKKHK